MKHLGVKLLLIFATASLLQADQNIQSNLDLVWVMVCAGLVFFMQAGFTALETGMVRAKNSINVAMKNVVDMIFAVIGYFVFGFAIMFGATQSGLFGTSGFLLDGFTSNFDYTFFIFQAVFAGTAVTIVSGSVAERMQFSSYIIVSILVSSFIYPVVGHWGWGGALLEGETGWLADKGFIDFAGSTIVHSVGAWVGLAGAIVLGARIGRFDSNGKPVDIQPFSHTYVAIGVFILWFGWFGFNGGSTIAGDGSFAKVIVNTSLSASAAGIASLVFSIIYYKQSRVEKVLFGIVAGLVGITAGCSAVDPIGAIGIGITSSIVMHLGENLLLKLKIDDPVGAVPIHGFAGAWGTIAIAFFAPESQLINNSVMDQLLVQLTGVVAVFFWSFIAGLIIFTIFKKLNILRVPKEHEEVGLNIAEHGAKMGWFDTIKTIKSIVDSGDFNHRCDVEIGTETGEVSHNFNMLLEYITKKLEDDNAFLQDISQIAKNIKEGRLDHRLESSNLNEQMEELKNVINDMLDNLEDNIGSNINDILTVLEEYDQYNFTQKVANPKGKIEKIINKLGEDTSKMLYENMHSGLELKNDSSTLQQSTSHLSSESQIQSDNISQAAKEADEINENIKLNNQKSNQMAQLATSVQKSANSGMEMTTKTANAMEEINKATSAINDSIQAIESIAFQTNILSLNAAVEAATAGEAGKGFAVVAGEVRNLATRSADAAKDIRDLVESAGIKTLEGQKTSEQMSQEYLKLNSQISQTLGLIDEVAASSNLQIQAIEHIHDTIFKLDDMLKKNLDVTHKANEIAQKTFSLANELVENAAEKFFIGKDELQLSPVQAKY